MEMHITKGGYYYRLIMMNKKNIILIILASVLLLSILLSVILNHTNQMKAFQNSKNDSCGVLSVSLEKREAVVDAVIDDTMAYAIVSKTGRIDFGDTLVIFKQKEKDSWERVYENDFKKLKPWKIELADIDGDNIKELVTAVRKTTHFDKSTKNRFFVFNYMEGKLVKKWTGSQIAGKWETFAVGDFAPTNGSEVAFIQQTNTGERVSVYYWYDFGFLLLMESKDYKSITDISISDTNRINITYKNGEKERSVTLTAQDGKLVEADGGNASGR
jgi:uncharacterized protein YpmB